MTINLNKEIISKEGLLKYIKDVDVYQRYMDEEIKLEGSMKSPLRKEDNPSFGFFIGLSGEICFNDFVYGGGDFVKFVQLKFGLNFFEALSKICIDFNLTKHFFYKNVKKTTSTYDPSKFQTREELLASVTNFRLRKKSRDWKLHDLNYWLQFGIDIETLQKYHVEPISYIFINQKVIRADKYAYCFTEWKDGVETYKIYQPFSEDYKWLNNHDFSVWQGWMQMPDKGENLIITKSLKDVMSITNITDYPSVSLQAESVMPKTHIIKQLEERFETIYLLYDNDYDKEVNWGQEFAKKLCDKYNLKNIVIGDDMECKDYSDLVKKIGMDDAKEYLENLILTYLPF